MDRQYQKLFGTLRDSGYSVPKDAMIMDLGCGNGDYVKGLMQLGYDAYGCDLSFRDGTHLESLQKFDRIRLINWDPYQIPFEDNTFDLITSNQVFEHVTDYVTTLTELKRVLKPGGISFHQFPSRYRLLEAHVNVPLASTIQSRWWLRLWGQLGIRNQYQRGMSSREVANRNYEYLRAGTRYHTTKELRIFFSQVFNEFRFCELELVRFTKLSPLFPVMRRIPFMRELLSNFHTRAIATRKSPA